MVYYRWCFTYGKYYSISTGLVQVGSALADFECCLCNPGSTPGPGLSFFLNPFFNIYSVVYSILFRKYHSISFTFSLFSWSSLWSNFRFVFMSFKRVSLCGCCHGGFYFGNRLRVFRSSTSQIIDFLYWHKVKNYSESWGYLRRSLR